MKVMASDVISQTMGHVARPTLGRPNMVAHPGVRLRLRSILNRLRHAAGHGELSQQARWLSKRPSRRLTRRLGQLSENSAVRARRRGRRCPA
jgi:hypothetical protein